jgi:hypothetical protein
MREVIQTSDGGYAVIGQTSLQPYSAGHYSVGYVMKLSSTGAVQWTKSLAGLSYAENFGHTIIQNAAGEYICGVTIQFHPDYNTVNYNPCIVKLSTSGAIIWSHAIENTNGSAKRISIVNNNQYIVCGDGNASYSGGNGSDALMAKYDNAGNKLWSRYYNYAPNVGNPNESGESCKVLNNGDIILVGYSYANGANTSLVVRTNNIGVEQWHNSSSNNTQYYLDGIISSSGSLWVTGGSGSDLIIRSLDLTNGNVVSNYPYNAGVGASVRECSNGDIAACGSTNNQGAGGFDAWLIRLGTSTGISPVTFVNTIKVYPNPASTSINIDFGSNYATLVGYTMRIDNSIGQTVYTTPVNQQLYTSNLNGWSGNGLYLVYLLNPQGAVVDVRKIIIQ